MEKACKIGLLLQDKCYSPRNNLSKFGLSYHFYRTIILPVPINAKVVILLGKIEWLARTTTIHMGDRQGAPI